MHFPAPEAMSSNFGLSACIDKQPKECATGAPLPNTSSGPGQCQKVGDTFRRLQYTQERNQPQVELYVSVWGWGWGTMLLFGLQFRVASY